VVATHDQNIVDQNAKALIELEKGRWYATSRRVYGYRTRLGRPSP